MKWFIRILKNHRLLIAVIFFLAVVGIIAASFIWPAVFDLKTTILCIAVAALMYLLLLVLENSRANREAQSLEVALRSQAQEQLLGVRPDKKPEIEQLQQRFDEAIQRLKTSRLGRGRSGKAALYALPWYMFIGPSAAGKTTAIKNSGLDFPVGDEAVKGVGGTRNCDWFFSNSAILLDTAGRYMMEEEDQEEWLAFLQMLKKHRRKAPINGIIVGISIAELADASPDEIDRHAILVRKRINELMEQLGVRFPVYLVFTKCDLLQGFVEFFEDYGIKQRSQVWGCTFTSDQLKSGNISAIFDEEFRRLSEALVEMRIEKLSKPMPGDHRHKVYVFPMELALVGDKLQQFISKVFQPNPYQDEPRFRGFYFTSGTQEGVPIDRVIQSIAAQFNLPNGHLSAPPETEAKSYFIRDLFQDVIIPDSDLVQLTTGTRRRLAMLRQGVFGGALAILAALIIMLSSAFIQNKEDLAIFQNAVQQLQQIDWDQRPAAENFRILEVFRQQFTAVAEPWYSFNIHKEDEMKRVALRQYFDRLTPFVQKHLCQDQFVRSFRGYSAGRNSPEGRARALANLHAYLLLSSEQSRLKESHEADFLKRHLIAAAEQALGPAQEQEDNNLVMPAVKAAMENYTALLARQSTGVVPFDEDMVQSVRERLRERPTREALYQNLKANLEKEMRGGAFTINDALDFQSRRYFTGETDVPAIFTKAAQPAVAKEIDNLSKNPFTGNWVLDISPEDTGDLPEELMNKDANKQYLYESYYRDYAAHWWKFLRGVRVNSFANPDEAARFFEVMSDYGNSPLVQILDRITEQTSLNGGWVQTVARSVTRQATQILDGLSGQHPVTQQFLVIHQIARGEAGPGGDLNEAISHFREVQSELENLRDAEPAEVAAYAAGVIEREEGSLPTALRAVTRTLGRLDNTTRRNLVEKPLIQAWHNVLAVTQRHLNNAWREKVYQRFNSQLARQYPFNRSNSADAPLEDVYAFFNGVDGAIQEFRKVELGPFLRPGQSGRVKEWQNAGINLSQQFRRALQKAWDISRGLGIENGGQIAVDFWITPELPEPQGKVSRTILIVDGNELIYRMGSAFEQRFTWPDRTSPRSSLEVHLGDRAFQLYRVYEGEWGFLRLLEHADIQSISTSRKWLLFRYPDKRNYQLTIRYKFRASSNNPFINPGFFDFSCPERLD